VAVSDVRYGVDNGRDGIAASLVFNRTEPDADHSVAYVPEGSGSRYYLRAELEGGPEPVSLPTGRRSRRLRIVPPLGGVDIRNAPALDGILPRPVSLQPLSAPVREVVLADPSPGEWLKPAAFVLVVALAIRGHEVVKEGAA
jgi:hypothetical protein